MQERGAIDHLRLQFDPCLQQNFDHVLILVVLGCQMQKGVAIFVPRLQVGPGLASSASITVRIQVQPGRMMQGRVFPSSSRGMGFEPRL